MSSMVVFQLFCAECDLVFCMDTRDEFCHAVESAIFVRAPAISSHMRCMSNVLCESCQSIIERRSCECILVGHLFGGKGS